MGKPLFAGFVPPEPFQHGERHGKGKCILVNYEHLPVDSPYPHALCNLRPRGRGDLRQGGTTEPALDAPFVAFSRCASRSPVRQPCSSLPPRGTQARPAPPVTFMLSSQRTVAARRYLDSSGHSKIGAAFIPLVQPLTVQSSALAGTAANTDRPSSSETNIFMILLPHTVVISAHVGCGPKDQKAPSRIADWT